MAPGGQNKPSPCTIDGAKPAGRTKEETVVDKEIARARFLAMCEANREDLRKVLELYQSGKVGTHDAHSDTTDRSIREVLVSLKEWERTLEDK